MSDIKIDELLEEFANVMDYFIAHKANVADGGFYNNVDKLINIKSEMHVANELNKTTEPSINYDGVLPIGRKCIHATCSKDECPFVMNDEIECPLH